MKTGWIATSLLLAQLLDGGAMAGPELEFSTANGSGGVPLSVVRGGNSDGPDILFIHGFSQSYLSWSAQLGSDLADDFSLVAFDLRGHGASGKPSDPQSYKSSQLWADDVAAIIEQQALKRPVLVGWSWAGFIIMNYVRHYGVDGIAGINLVGANTSLRGPVGPPPSTEGSSLAWFQQMLSPDIAANIEGVTTFIDIVTAEPLPPDVRETQIRSNLMTPHYVRAAMAGYPADNSDLAATITVPVLISHGTEDAIIDYTGAVSIVDVLPDARVSTYENIGHAPFIEDPRRFNHELSEFVRGAQ